MQTSGADRPSAARIAASIWRQDGPAGFFRGLSAPLCSLTILNFVAFGLIAETRMALGLPRSPSVEASSTFEPRVILSGIMVAPFISLISTPFELLKVQQQVDRGRERRTYKGAPSVLLQRLLKRRLQASYRGCRHPALRGSSGREVWSAPHVERAWHQLYEGAAPCSRSAAGCLNSTLCRRRCFWEHTSQCMRSCVSILRLVPWCHRTIWSRFQGALQGPRHGVYLCHSIL